MITQTDLITKNYIGGQWHELNEKGRSVYSPSNINEKIGDIHYSTQEQITAAVSAAREGFKTWKQKTGVERAACLYKMADNLEKAKETVANLASREMGKPISEMIGEVMRGVNLLRYYAAEGVRPDGQLVPASDQHVLQYSKRVPLGVVALITPWNFPVAIPIWKIAPALICGNSIVWKPADNAVFTAGLLMEVFEDAGLPAGVLNLVIAKGRSIGDTLLEEGDIDAVSFTGSTSTGMQIASACAKRNIKYQTEMGGKNAAIVLKDADLEKAIPMILSGAFRSAGQKCTATSRIIVEKDIYSDFINHLRAAVSNLTVKDALQADAYLGPVASKSQFDTISEYVALARNEGEIIAEGIVEQSNQGYYIRPIVVGKVGASHRLFTEEIFGPVAAVVEVENFEEAVRLCNQSEYGLSASIFTNDMEKAMRFLEEAEIGMVRVNQETAGVEYQAPFGGMKSSSSHTREQGQAALDFYSQVKTCAIKYAF
ncbi:aldehyde dehydrogenase family protein [Bacillus sp. UNC438CL73TsuS30]|uniref:aldehyde dehydrogenase family protein n=1 Tax=Bacillus sp. UNC438CL73TsuS30 TaxID=1340434 RepID=UPI00047A5BEF|nr:aldehyde dehydrogenase family protein [Bacillus sp. UNC438CL73TsuS30]